MNTKSILDIDPIYPPEPNWDHLIPNLSKKFPNKSFYHDQDRYELRIGHTLAVQPAWATENGNFCYVDRTGQAWCSTGEDDIYKEIEDKAIPAWRIGWLEPFQSSRSSYAWRQVPTCIYTDEDLIHHLGILMPMVGSVWDMLSDYGVKEPESDDEVVGLLWAGME